MLNVTNHHRNEKSTMRKKNPHTLFLGMQVGVATTEDSIGVSQKLKNGTALWPRNFTSGYLSETQNTDLKEHKHPYVHCAIIYNSQHTEATQVPINGQMDKKPVVYINGMLLGHKKHWNLTICCSMDWLTGYYTQWNKSDKERQIPYDFTYMWSLKNKKNEQTKWKQTHKYRKQTDGCWKV